ncbi:MAG: hypothetical protein LBD94_00865 [Rickettsiales bacterium]|jgi:hypothetical protein|nr:hypothetical protein [Rickettsiales bacterium]
MKAAIIKVVIQIVLWAIVLGVGIWYLSSSIGGTSLPYVSFPRFLNSIGACENGICDIASANGCFLCPYIQKLFLIIGNATEVLWNAIIGHTWILMVVGLVVFMFWKAYEVITKANEQNAKLDDVGARTLKFTEEWFNAVKDLLLRVLIVAAILGAAWVGGTSVMKATSDTVVYPVMSIGTSLSMAATGMNQGATCGMEIVGDDNLMAGVSNSFMCVIGNLNAVVLSGANAGFSMMNFAWLGMGGGVLTWIAGLVIVLMFLFIGIDVLFKVLNVIFGLVFIIIFLPLIAASFAFDKVWKKIAGGVSKGAIEILAKTAVQVVGITIRIMILYSLTSYAFTSTMSSNPVAEYAIIEKCENLSALPDGKMDKDVYVLCFNAERAANPDAFKHLDKGWDFLVMMLFLFAVYYALVDKKLQGVMGLSGENVDFKFGENLKSFGKTIWNTANQLVKKIPVKK